MNIKKYQQAAEEFERILKDAGFSPILVGSVARSYSSKLQHEPKDIDFVVRRSGFDSARLFLALRRYERNGTLAWCNYLVSQADADALSDNPMVRVGDECYGKVEIWVHEFQPIYKGIHIDLFKEFPVRD